MATPPMSAVPDCDSQTRPAPTGCGHQMSAAQGCDIPVRELQSAPSGNHRCQRQQFKTVAAIRCQCQHSHSVAAITSLQSTTEAPTASISMLWPRDANQDPSQERELLCQLFLQWQMPPVSDCGPTSSTLLHQMPVPALLQCGRRHPHELRSALQGPPCRGGWRKGDKHQTKWFVLQPAVSPTQPSSASHYDALFRLHTSVRASSDSSTINTQLYCNLLLSIFI